MATVGGNRILVNGVTLTAGAADTTSDTWNKGQSGGTALIKITNGGTGPTVAAQVQPEASWDGIEFFTDGGPLVAGVVAATPYSWTYDPPEGCSNVRFVCGSNTDEDVTVMIHVQGGY